MGYLFVHILKKTNVRTIAWQVINTTQNKHLITVHNLFSNTEGIKLEIYEYIIRLAVISKRFVVFLSSLWRIRTAMEF